MRVRGLSPRVRGNLALLDEVIHDPRVCGGTRDVRQVYPRVCGGTPSASERAVASTGLSPRVRGNHTTPTT